MVRGTISSGGANTQTGLTRTCFFFPLESFKTPSALSADLSTINLGSLTGASFEGAFQRGIPIA